MRNPSLGKTSVFAAAANGAELQLSNSDRLILRTMCTVCVSNLALHMCMALQLSCKQLKLLWGGALLQDLLQVR